MAQNHSADQGGQAGLDLRRSAVDHCHRLVGGLYLPERTAPQPTQQIGQQIESGLRSPEELTQG